MSINLLKVCFGISHFEASGLNSAKRKVSEVVKYGNGQAVEKDLTELDGLFCWLCVSQNERL